MTNHGESLGFFYFVLTQLKIRQASAICSSEFEDVEYKKHFAKLFRVFVLTVSNVLCTHRCASPHPIKTDPADSTEGLTSPSLHLLSLSPSPQTGIPIRKYQCNDSLHIPDTVEK